MLPIEPPASVWDLSQLRLPEDEEVVAVGGDLEPGTLLEAYRSGLFPMGTGRRGRPPLGWWSPLERGVLGPGELHISRSLRRSARHFEISVNRAFAEVVAGCADPARSGAWITAEVAQGYQRLHGMGWAHSVEVWQDEQLAGGLYGVAVGGLFAGESMFHRVSDASKVALWALAELCFADGHPQRLIDVQWQTPHLASLGVGVVTRAEYRQRLQQALAVPVPEGLLTAAG